jgi:hypothetical protein
MLKNVKIYKLVYFNSFFIPICFFVGLFRLIINKEIISIVTYFFVYKRVSVTMTLSIFKKSYAYIVIG